jgi:hypothetical protein
MKKVIFNSNNSHNQSNFHVKINFRLSILDNQEYWQVFQNHEHIVDFLTDNDLMLSGDSEEIQDSQKENCDRSLVLSPKN